MALITDATFESLRETLGLKKTGVIETRAKRVREPNVFQIPGSYFPHADFEDALWIKIKAKKLANINTSGRGGTLRIAEHGPTWKFLAPEELVEIHNHSWEPYDSFHSKLLEKIRAMHVGVDQFKQITKGLIEGAVDVWNEGVTTDFLAKAERAVIRGSNVDVPQYKIDTPMVYQTSDRRVFDIGFHLADAEGGAYMVDCIKLLQKYAAADAKEDEYSIEFPWVFEISTEPSDLIKVGYAAIKSIQPSWQQPYVRGNPVRAELQISFEDMSPLFKKTIETGTIINVNEDAARTKIVTSMSQTEQARILQEVK